MSEDKESAAAAGPDRFPSEPLVQKLIIYGDGTTRIRMLHLSGEDQVAEPPKKRKSIAKKLVARHSQAPEPTATDQQVVLEDVELNLLGNEQEVPMSPAGIPNELDISAGDREVELAEGEQKVVAELYLVERPHDESKDSILKSEFGNFFGQELEPGVIDGFLSYQSDDTIVQVPIYGESDSVPRQGDDETDMLGFYLKWSRHVLQKPELWKDEQRIRAGRPYDKDITGNLKEMGIPHTRLARAPEVCRGYYFICERNDIIHHARKEAVSCLGRQTNAVYRAVLLFDPPQHLTRTRWKRGLKEEAAVPTTKKALVGDVRCRDRFKGSILGRIRRSREAETPSDANSVKASVKETLMSFVLRDELEVQAWLSKSLDDVELSLGDDKNVVDRLTAWRSFFGEWRNRLFHLEPMLDLIEQQLSRQDGGRETPATLSNLLEAVKKALKAMNHRMEGTYEAVMLTISIIESERAVREARAVTKLTNLAFFFIPLSLVAAILAMPLDEFRASNDMKVWLWVTLSASLLVTVYSVLYRKELVQAIQNTAAFLRNWASGNLAEICEGLAFFLLGILMICLLLGFYATCGVGVWKIVTDTNLSQAAKGGLAFLVVLTALSGLICCCASICDD